MFSEFNEVSQPNTSLHKYSIEFNDLAFQTCPHRIPNLRLFLITVCEEVCWQTMSVTDYTVFFRLRAMCRRTTSATVKFSKFIDLAVQHIVLNTFPYYFISNTQQINVNKYQHFLTGSTFRGFFLFQTSKSANT